MNQEKLAIDWTNCFRFLCDVDISNKREIGQRAAVFLNSFVDSCLTMAEYGKKKTGLRTIILSGNLYENNWIAKMIARVLRNQGFEVILSPDIPFDESSVCIGQIFYAKSVRL